MKNYTVTTSNGSSSIINASFVNLTPDGDLVFSGADNELLAIFSKSNWVSVVKH